MNSRKSLWYFFYLSMCVRCFTFAEDTDEPCHTQFVYNPEVAICLPCGRPCIHECCVNGEWFPQGPPLFRPLMADPREIDYSVGWRFNDRLFTHNVIDVSFGDTIGIYEWYNVWPVQGGKLRLNIEAAVWAIFDPLHDSSPLINADYYIGFPITYAFDRWAFRFRIFHISSHIGDEFLLNHKHFRRLNPSSEYTDFYVSNQFTDDIRVYGGVGWIIQQDESFDVSPFYAQGGLELRLRAFEYINCCQKLYGVPIYAMDFRYKPDFTRHVDATYILGYEIGKTVGSAHKWRVFMEYHDGYSVEGQFCRFPTHYFALRTSYGY